MDPVRVAAVGYTNTWPLLTRLDRIRYRVMERHPAEVARLLREGEADVGLVPVAALLDGEDWRIVPGFCIGSKGAVHSVLLVGETPPEQWTALVLDGVSRTSVILARLLFPHLPTFDAPPGGALPLAGGTTAALVIGDAARQLPARFTHVVDLGEKWFETTGLPFVFAVWAGRPDLSHDTIEGLRRAASEGMGLREALPEPDRSYLLHSIRYELDDAALSGMRRFAAMAADAGLVKARDLQLYGPPRRMRPRPDLDSLLSKGASGGRLERDEALRLHEEAPIADLLAAADLRRWQIHPTDEVTYIISRNINYTNVCVTACKFCAFYRPKRHREAYVLSDEQVFQKCDELVKAGGVEVLLQGGLHPELGIEYYEELFRFIKSNFPLDLHALSPEEILHIMNVSKLSLDQVLDRLRAAGMDSLPGGGAEVLDDEIRQVIAPLKCTTEEWLMVMEAAHRRGMKSSATLMFGMMDQPRHRVDHLLRLRALQDKTGGFVAFICWTFQPDNTYVKAGENTAADYLRVNALSRLVLDNFSNLQASWVTQGPGVAQASLHGGCNDYGSIMMEENVVSAAGTTFKMTAADVERNIRTAGFVPVRRNARYDHVGAALTAEQRA